MTFVNVPLGKAKSVTKPRVNMGRYYTGVGTLEAWSDRNPPIVFTLEGDVSITQEIAIL